MIEAQIYVGVTDFDWVKTIKQGSWEEVNFWKPGGRVNFKALNAGEMFLFKLHSPQDYIVGGGFFFKFSILPSSLAWDAFGIANGASSLLEFKNKVYKYKNTNRLSDPDPKIGCVILSKPFFFKEKDWIPVPKNWKSNIVQGKLYNTSETYGLMLFEQVTDIIKNKDVMQTFIKEDIIKTRYGKELLIKPRIGQGTFKMLITEAYRRRCAITGEMTLPVLEAAHIRPYSLEGPHSIDNGLLLRRDFHILFDRGYITINRSLIVEVSHHIKDDFGNGKEYYAYHGSKLTVLPELLEQRPNNRYLEWHNENIYLG